ncbi:reticulocyte-binding protein 2 homolog a-like [Chrysoperla carnea]|uniref:reticulocyte-binding protein 2 homolog a-like n=1 Tax=Chrysoperla carnea TaxID=189513 RepID=UPI001D07A7FC|nr:reticulocyte-binding protein 2 homolog a-like [Chrysoperla carnea]
MDYDSVNYNIEETNTELANYGSWSFMTVEGHSSNVVIRLNNTKNANKTDLDAYGDDGDCLSSTSSTSGFSLHHDDTEPSSLLEVIDDKNKEIHQLKRINYNQKLQLNYYLKKSLINDTIATLGRSINLNALEEYDAINFSMARFNKANNRKSRILRAYEKLNSLDSKISHLLKRQENLLRKVTLDVLNASAERSLATANNKNSNHDKENKNGDGEFVSYVSQLDAFSKLLATTLSVKRELEHIKNYSMRIITIEEERNSLVDYIYQLPVEQRLNGSYLLSVEREKAKLCLEMSNIRNDQKMLKEKISKLNHEEEILKETAKELKAQSITLPAPIESGLTKEERTKLLNQIQDLQNENQILQDKITYQDQSLQDYAENESKLIDAQSKCAALEHKVETLTRQKHDLENELLNLSKLQTDYQELLHANEALKKKFSNQRILEDEVCELRQKVKKMDTIIEERNKLQSQMEEYQSLVHAVENNPEIDKNIMKKPDSLKEFCNKISKIQDLESDREVMKDKFDKLAGALLQQDDQIKNLLNIFERFGDYRLNKKPSLERNKDKTIMNDMYFINLAKQIADKFNNSRIRDILVDKNVVNKTRNNNNVVVDVNGASDDEQTIKKLIDNCQTSNSATRLRNCSSNEALQSVFGPNKVGHTTKIIETGELLSKLNCHIDSLEETTRGFCSKNVIKSSPSLQSVQSSMLSIKDSEMESHDNLAPQSENNPDSCEITDNTESQINLLDLPSKYGGESLNSSSKSKLPVRASSVPPILRKIHDNNLYSQMMGGSSSRKLKDLCTTNHGNGESNMPEKLSKTEEKKKKIVPEAGDDLSSNSSSGLVVDRSFKNKNTDEMESDKLKKIDDNDKQNTKKLNNLHFNIQLNTNKKKVIGDLKEIQNQLETLDNSENADDLRNNFKKFYSKIFGENIDGLN